MQPITLALRERSNAGDYCATGSERRAMQFVIPAEAVIQAIF